MRVQPDLDRQRRCRYPGEPQWMTEPPRQENALPVEGEDDRPRWSNQPDEMKKMQLLMTR